MACTLCSYIFIKEFPHYCQLQLTVCTGKRQVCLPYSKMTVQIPRAVASPHRVIHYRWLHRTSKAFLNGVLPTLVLCQNIQNHPVHLIEATTHPFQQSFHSAIWWLHIVATTEIFPLLRSWAFTTCCSTIQFSAVWPAHTPGCTCWGPEGHL